MVYKIQASREDVNRVSNMSDKSEYVIGDLKK